MIQAMLATVKPRVLSVHGEGRVALEDVVSDCLRDDRVQGILLRGGEGSGKSTALRHLAARFGDRYEIILVDDGDSVTLSSQHPPALIVSSAPHAFLEAPTCLDLAPWSDDDSIEYLLRVNPGECAGVLNRVADDSGRELLAGSPQLWTAVLSAISSDPDLCIRAGLLQVLHQEMGDLVTDPAVGALAVATFDFATAKPEAARRRLLAMFPRGRRWLRHRGVRLVLATRWLSMRAEEAGSNFLLHQALGADIIDELALLISESPEAMRSLHHAIVTNRLVSYGAAVAQSQWSEVPAPNAWSSSHGLSNNGTRPPRRPPTECPHGFPPLNGLQLGREANVGSSAPTVRLDGARLRGANFAHSRAITASLVGADLTDANLDGCVLRGSNLQCVNLRGASVRGADLKDVILRSADLSYANLCNSNLIGAALEGASFEHSCLDGVDLTGVNLANARFTGASFAGAAMEDCRATEINFDGVDLHGANLRDANLERASARHASFFGSSLRGASLHGIDLEGADLRRADLANVTFHFGSRNTRRSDTFPIANLRFVDLRGAYIRNADFRGVDLRGARVTATQREYLVRSRALLD